MGALALGAPDILRSLKSVGLCTNLDAPPDQAQLTFDQVLSAFYQDLSRKGELSPEIPPLPAIVGEGCPVDLLRLFCLVKDRGGYRSVTVTQSWHAVSESVGLRPGFGPAVKLVYSKYLGSLERWAQSFPKKNSGPTPGKAGSRSTQHANDKSALNGAHLTGELPLHKRKRDATIGMLNWLRAIAKKPCDVSYKIGSSLKDAKSGKSSPTADYFTLAMILRREMFIKKIRKDCSVNHPKQVTPLPSSSNSKKTRTSPRLNSTALPPVTFNPSSTKQHSIPVPPSVSWLSMDEESDIPVGPNHQADIPDFTDHVSMSDPITLKYLGTSFWSPNHKSPFQASKTPIGEAGISQSCKCSIPGSSECIRLHVAESKLKLKCELGNSFYTMGFHKMGEEVALSWTQKEEEKFKSIIRANLPSDDKKFWPPLFVNFRSKGWKGLVSYYYNVFLLRRRRYQNKAVPVKIDSDDDDIESGFLDGDLDASRVCAENRQCVNLDP